MGELERIAQQWTTDKGVIGHHYLQYYEWYTERMRESATKVLEIGVDLGKSHRMWRDYFPNATVIGLDSDRQYVTGVDLGERIELLLGNQNDPAMMEELASRGPYDLIVDDGSHIPQHQLLSFQLLFPALRPGGVYIIEDIAKHGEEGDQEAMTWQYLIDVAMGIQGRGWIIAQYAWDEWNRLDWWGRQVDFVHVYRWACVIGRSDRAS